MINFLPYCEEMFRSAVLSIDAIRSCQEELWPEEEVLAHGAIPARLREIRAGRCVARRAIHVLKAEPGPILSNEVGNPIWPAGVCGSISHSASHVAAAVALIESVVSVGIDILDGRSLGPTVTDSIATPEELEALQQCGLMTNAQDIAADQVAFSIKEAIFKCQYPLTLLSKLDFLEVTLGVGDRGDLVLKSNIEGGALGMALSRMRIEIESIQCISVAVAVVLK